MDIDSVHGRVSAENCLPSGGCGYILCLGLEGGCRVANAVHDVEGNDSVAVLNGVEFVARDPYGADSAATAGSILGVGTLVATFTVAVMICFRSGLVLTSLAVSISFLLQANTAARSAMAEKNFFIVSRFYRLAIKESGFIVFRNGRSVTVA